ncbi:uncharacterized protein [Magallana gigas]|uniref:uncharacterized protein isoform X1 n=1 Tax=Magallana gigas TaxID=29159 RepID=UPI0033400E33
MSGQRLRFVHLNSEELDSLIDEKNSANTTKVINSSVSVLKTFCNESGTNVMELYTTPKPELQEFLKSFYAGLRNSDGETYAKRSMISIRYGLQKHFLKKRKLDIVNDPDFKEANNVFLAMCTKIKKEGKGAVVHKDPISRPDLQKLYSSFDLKEAEGLQNKVFVDYMLYFCNRGRENLRELGISDFSTGTDAEGRRFVYMARDHATKNHRNDENQSQGGRMYELKDSILCPYGSFLSYINKLNQDLDVLWQRPSKGNELKYDKIAVGKNTLGDKMKNLSKKAGLSKIYTNHCLRATSITELDRSGFEARHIMSISGHQSESSIRSYSAHVDDKKKLDMAMSISKAITGDSIHAENNAATLRTGSNSSSTMSLLQDDDIAESHFQDMDFLEITDSQERRLLETFVTHETRTTNLNLYQEKENRPAKIQPAPIMHINNSSVNVHYHYY